MIKDTYVPRGNFRPLVLVKAGFESSLEINWDAFWKDTVWPFAS